MFDEALLALARQTLDEARAAGLRIATAESCTGGLIAALLTEIPGASDVIERGFVSYSNEAKEDLLGVPAALIHQYGAVSQEVVRAMAEGALEHSLAQLSVGVTGIAGPGGGTAEKPVGLVYIAVQRSSGEAIVRELRLGDIGRGEIRRQTMMQALEMLRDLIA